ncbi:M56 family metallopeptidase [Qipengyuania sp.]|uniref:M56 family metallopeptidase n=1 Tax=Qipengyuania sp. TaxID=2004515 RepID=UPI0035C8360B
MSGYLVDTLVWTGALIALVLVLRRPVSRHLGAGAAYGLWLLPMARLVMPPLVLPAWLAPSDVAPVSATDMPAADFVPVAYEAVTAAPVASAYPAEAFDWQALAIALWLLGAAIFLARRYTLYFRMRRDLLANARPVGECGRIRLIESPGADGPVAFGVIDKVVALPEGFMANANRSARDLALAHELAHHRGRDLLANMIVQPLFALHWFNPLGIYGWQAMRRDQEAACDARVIIGRPRVARAAYAEVIAGYAKNAAPTARLALAAPMACPVLGDRSIVHRLKALSMKDPTRRRRWSARMLLAGAALALPLTASISYAHDEIPDAPLAPEPPEAPMPPAPPAPPAWEDHMGTIHDIDAELAHLEQGSDGRNRYVWIERSDDGHSVRKHVVVRHGDAMTDRQREEMEQRLEEAEQRREEAQERREEAEQRREEVRDRIEEAHLRAEEARDRAEEARERAAEASERRAEQASMRSEVQLAIAEARSSAPIVKTSCRSGQREVTETVTDRNGRETIYICQAVAFDEARRGLAEARREVSRNREMTASARAVALGSIDEALRGLGHN